MIEDIKSSVNNDIFERFLQKKNLNMGGKSQDSDCEESSNSEGSEEHYEETNFKEFGKIESRIY